MFYEWVSAGAIFGIQAFCALTAFALCCCAVIGLLAVLVSIVRGGKRDE